jgi:hypothetical protein
MNQPPRNSTQLIFRIFVGRVLTRHCLDIVGLKPDLQVLPAIAAAGAACTAIGPLSILRGQGRSYKGQRAAAGVKFPHFFGG